MLELRKLHNCQCLFFSANKECLTESVLMDTFADTSLPMKPLITILFLLLMASLTKAQHYSFPAHEKLFTDTEVPKVYITIHPDSLALLYDNVLGNYNFPVKVKFSSSTIQDSISNIGMGLRGNTSLYAQKKSFQLTFDAHVPGQKFYGLEKMNLIGQHNDPAIIRTKMTWDLFSSFGIPCPRSNHVEVYINGNYYGLYMNVEHIDDEFCQSRFRNDDGNLYKCYWGTSLAYIGTSPNDYKFEINGRRAYELKNNKQDDDYTDLYQFINVLNNTPINQLACELENVFNVHNYLKCMAIEILAGHWDNYIYNINNYFLYHNTETGKFEYIPYDVDNTWGIDWLGVNWTTQNMYQFKPNGAERPLYDRILQVPEYKNLFSHYMNVIANSTYMSADIFTRIQNIKTMITPSAQADIYRTLDYGFTMNDFNNSYTQALGGHVAHGIIPYIQQRVQTINQQLQLNNINPEIFYPILNYPRPTDSLFFQCKVNDDVQVTEVLMNYSLNSGSTNTLPLYDDGLHFDGNAGDRVYGSVLIIAVPQTLIQYSFSATDNTAQNSILPKCSAYSYLHKPLVPSLVINEFMADNTSALFDEYGEANDWIELYNRSTGAVPLNKMFLSDNDAFRNKWPLPDYVLQPDSYVLVWCDKDGYQGDWHANFKINKSNGSLILSDAYQNDMAIIDYVTYAQQLTNKAYARIPNGTGNFIIQNATPLYNNELVSVREITTPEEKLYPNPAGDFVMWSASQTPQQVNITNTYGQLLFSTHDLQSNKIPLQALPSGLYHVRFIYNDTLSQTLPLIIIR